MNKKGSINIVLVILVIILAASVIYFALYKPESNNQPSSLTGNQMSTTSSQTQTTNNDQITSQTQSTNKTHTTEKDVTAQPAYLIAAYSKNEKNYIDVDYVEWLHGNASIQAQVADGECASANECYDYPNGYKRNRNPLIRTFEVSSSTPVNVSGNIASKFNALGQKLSISFKQLEDAVSKIKSYLQYNPPFKEPKTFITINVKNDIVTKIVEPYQE
jgi:uncharacterized protein YxeA